ncbi:TPA: prepilin peptidase [Candidatus Woesearchaeota archaeon]|nr:prepilin peptidase [Candidatus Woesearchaeota archaeon]
MIAESILFTIVLVALVIGTYTDLKTREVPDWLNYGMVFAGFGLRIIFSIVFHDADYMIHGILGFGAFFAIALLMFYTGQWGGGDAKMVMGLGALIGLELSINAFLIGFIVNIVLFGSLFGLLFSVYLAAIHFRSFSKEFSKRFKEKRKEKWFVWLGTIALLVLSVFTPVYIKVPVVVLAGIILVSFYMFIYLKSVESSSMIKWVDPKDLTEGDWVVKDVVVAGKRVCGPKDLGLEMAQIKKLMLLKKQNKIKRVLIKYGIPFVPSFLIAFVVTYFWGNIVFMIMGL